MSRDRYAVGTHANIETYELPSGLWYARTRYRFPDGKRRYVGKSGTSARAATRRLTDKLLTVKSHATADTSADTKMEALGAEFLKSKKDKSPNTRQQYAYALERYVYPRVGGLRISEFTTQRAQELVTAVQNDHGPGAAKTTRSVVSGMMNLARRRGATTANPVTGLEPIKSDGDGAVPVPLPELPTLLANVRADARSHKIDMADLVEFSAGTGARVSEICGVRWCDVDLEAHTVRFKGSVIRVKGIGLIWQDHSKTDAGTDRIVTVSDSVIDMLGDRRLRMTQPTPHDVVFPTVRNNLRDPRNTNRDLADMRERCGFGGPYTFHSFRKTVATVLDVAGMSPRAIAEFLGHKDPALTQRVYMSKTVGGPAAANALGAAVRAAA